MMSTSHRPTVRAASAERPEPTLDGRATTPEPRIERAAPSPLARLVAGRNVARDRNDAAIAGAQAASSEARWVDGQRPMLRAEGRAAVSSEIAEAPMLLPRRGLLRPVLLIALGGLAAVGALAILRAVGGWF